MSLAFHKGSFDRMRLLLCSLALVMAAVPAFADRSAYSGVRDLAARGSTLMVRHHHDWSRTFKDGGWLLRYSAETPFGIDEETSNLEFYSTPDTLIVRVPSPPLTHLEISADGRYVIGLSNIKHLNSTQLVVFNSRGELLLRRRISARVFCFDEKEYEELKSAHREAFAELDRYSRQTYGSYGWRDGNNVYIDTGVSVGPHSDALLEDIIPAMCDSPLSPNFSESVTNAIYWYHNTNPQPRIVEKEGRPFEVRLRDPKGVEFAVKFERTPLTSDAEQTIQ